MISGFENKLSELARDVERAAIALRSCEWAHRNDEGVYCVAQEHAYEKAQARYSACAALVSQAKSCQERFMPVAKSYFRMVAGYYGGASKGLDNILAQLDGNYLEGSSSATGGVVPSGVPKMRERGDIGLGGDQMPPSAIHITGGDKIDHILPKGTPTDPVRIDPEAMAKKFETAPPIKPPDPQVMKIAAGGILMALAAGGLALGGREMLLQQKADEIFENQYGMSRTEMLMGSGPKQKEYLDAYNGIRRDLSQEVNDLQKQFKGNSDLMYEQEIADMSDDELKGLEMDHCDYIVKVAQSEYAYHEGAKMPEGWSDVCGENDTVREICDDVMQNGGSESGLKFSIMRKGDKYVVAFGGTDFPSQWTKWSQVREFGKDGYTDIKGFFDENERQVVLAKQLVQRLVKKGGIPLDKIEFTGHSLGGRIAAEMSVEFARPATTFNAAGVGEETRKRYENLIKNSKGYAGVRNIIMEHDVVSNAQSFFSGAKNPYVSALPKEKIQILHETVSNTLSSRTGKVSRTMLKATGLGVAVDKTLEVTDDGLDKLNTFMKYYNRDYRALGATLTLRDNEGAFAAHELATVKDSLERRKNAITNTIQKKIIYETIHQ